MASKLLWPRDIERTLGRRYQLQHASWLAGDGEWPLSLALGRPLERDVGDDAQQIRAWVDAWRSFDGPAQVHWEEVRWARLGPQRLPARVELAGPVEVARWLNEEARYRRAAARYAACITARPALESSRVLTRIFDVLADYTDEDWAKLTALLRWLLDNPRSGYAVRTIPVEGLDTKWLDDRRCSILSLLLRSLRPAEPNADFFALTGLSPRPARARLRILCPALRRQVGGLGDLEAPFTELSRLPLAPASCLIVENLESGLALTDLEGCVAFVGLGNGVVRLAELPWLRGARMLYWGDLDTHGFAILHRARTALGDMSSVLMDTAALLRFQPLWGREPVQNTEAGLVNLTPAEREVLEGLRTQRWGNHVRLEQERIPWETAWAAIRQQLAF